MLVRGRLTVLMLVLVLAGCAGRPGPEVLSLVAPVSGSTQVTVYAATTRAPASEDAVDFTAERAHSMRFARFTVSIPPTHEPTEIEWPAGAPDPSQSFAVVDRSVLPKQAFLDEVQAASRSAAGAATGFGAAIFVHGFNYNFPETVFRLAQLSADARLDGPQIAFAWPSQANLRGYLDDKNSAIYSRDYLAELIVDVAARTRGDIAVVGHSMGAWLVMETVRQLRLQGHDRVIDRLRVILAAPDIDVDVFRQQLDVIGPLETPMMVLVSPEDRALLVSQWLSASRPRIGTFDVRDPEVQAAAQAGNVQIVDISAPPLPGAHPADRRNGRAAAGRGRSAGAAVAKRPRHRRGPPGRAAGGRQPDRRRLAHRGGAPGRRSAARAGGVAGAAARRAGRLPGLGGRGARDHGRRGAG